MNPTRRKFIVSASAALFAASPALAQDDAATRSVIRQLEAQGFDVISVRRTLLGRVRILSRRGDLQREIVIDPRNGVVLRDYTTGGGGGPSIGGSREGATSGQGGEAPGSTDEDDDDDDDGDDDDDDDDDDGDDDGGDDGGDDSGDDDGDDGGDDDDDD